MKQLNLMQLGGGSAKLQEKTIYFDGNTVVVTPDEGYDGLSQVTVSVPPQVDIFSLPTAQWAAPGYGTWSVANHTASWYWDSNDGSHTLSASATSPKFDVTGFNYLYVTYSGSVEGKTAQASGGYGVQLRKVSTGERVNLVSGQHNDISALSGEWQIYMSMSNLYCRISLSLTNAMLKTNIT